VTRTPAAEPATLDLLEVGRRGPSRRTVLLVVVPLLALVATAVLVDQRARAAETTQVAACASRTQAVIHEETARMSGILGYVEPVWSYRLPPGIERRIAAMVSEAAVGTDRPLARVRRNCAAVEVLALHPGLRERQTACVQLLDTYTSFLRGVVRDGSRAAGAWPETDSTGC
jgi:hypothetical protein